MDLRLKKKNRWYLAETITETDYADGLVLLANTPCLSEISIA